MQIESHHIYERVAKNEDIDLNLVTAVGNFIQKEVSDNLRAPKSLIIKVKGLGTWYLRRIRMILGLRNYPTDRELSEFSKNNIERLKDRLSDYDLFLEKKKKVKDAKREYYSKKQSEDKP